MSDEPEEEFTAEVNDYEIQLKKVRKDHYAYYSKKYNTRFSADELEVMNKLFALVLGNMNREELTAVFGNEKLIWVAHRLATRIRVNAGKYYAKAKLSETV